MQSEYGCLQLIKFQIIECQIVFLCLVPLLSHHMGNLLAYVAVLFVLSVSELSRARGADMRTGYSKSPGRRIESVTAKVLIF